MPSQRTGVISGFRTTRSRREYLVGRRQMCAACAASSERRRHRAEESDDRQADQHAAHDDAPVHQRATLAAQDHGAPRSRRTKRSIATSARGTISSAGNTSSPGAWWATGPAVISLPSTVTVR